MGFWTIIGAGWRGAFGAIAANWKLFTALLSANAVLETVMALADPLHYKQDFTSGQSIMVPVMGPLHLAIHSVIFFLLFSFLAAPCMVAVHRHVLLREHGAVAANRQRLIIFGMLFFGVRFVLFTLPSALLWASYFFGLLYLVSLWLIGRLVLTYPAAALDQPSPLILSWRRTRGHWWFVAGVMTLGLFPISLPTEPFTYLIMYSTPETATRLYDAQIALSTFTGLLYAAIGAGMASELFRKFCGVPVQD